LASTISFLAWRAWRSPVWTGLDDAAEVVDRHAGLGGEGGHVLADVGHLAGVVVGELGPAHAQRLDLLGPVGVELGAEVGAQELGAGDAVAVGQAQQAALVADQLAVDGVELLDQGLDAVVVELQRAEVGGDRGGERGVLGALLGREVLAGQALFHQGGLQAVEGLEVGGDGVEDAHHALAQVGLHGGDRGAGAVVEVVLAFGLGFGGGGGRRGGAFLVVGRRRRRGGGGGGHDRGPAPLAPPGGVTPGGGPRRGCRGWRRKSAPGR
jgi:hypothetical protein